MSQQGPHGLGAASALRPPTCPMPSEGWVSRGAACSQRAAAESRSYLINDGLCNCRSVRAACAVCDGLSRQFWRQWPNVGTLGLRAKGPRAPSITGLLRQPPINTSSHSQAAPQPVAGQCPSPAPSSLQWCLRFLRGAPRRGSSQAWSGLHMVPLGPGIPQSRLLCPHTPCPRRDEQAPGAVARLSLGISFMLPARFPLLEPYCVPRRVPTCPPGEPCCSVSPHSRPVPAAAPHQTPRQLLRVPRVQQGDPWA